MSDRDEIIMALTNGKRVKYRDSDDSDWHDCDPECLAGDIQEIVRPILHREYRIVEEQQ